MSADVDRLHRQWVEIREEGDRQRLVFRPSDYPVPPARGRRWLDLRDQGRVISHKPGADDRPVSDSSGVWHVQNDRLDLQAPGWQGHYRIERLERDLMILQRISEEDTE